MNDKTNELGLEATASTYRHYLRTDGEGLITEGWSDGPCPEKGTEGAVLLREDGGYQFRLAPDGEENPALWSIQGIPLYRWDDGKAVLRPEEELRAQDAVSLPDPRDLAIAQLMRDVAVLKGGEIHV